MYSTCLFCHRALGANMVIESFPVGRRLAFDAAKGRLWIVCRRCGRWNLSPLEERWEAIEAGERRFREARLRVSTDNIGLARFADGTELVRVGRAARGELAAWRYGDQFGHRRRRIIAFNLAAGAAGAPLIVGAWGFAAGAWMVPLYLTMPVLGAGYITVLRMHHRWMRSVVARADAGPGESIVIRGKHLAFARLVPPLGGHDVSEWTLETSHDDGVAELRGADAMRVASRVLARINAQGADERIVARAVDRLEDGGAAETLFARIAARPRHEPSAFVRWGQGAAGYGSGHDVRGTLRSLVAADRLALEMATHEESERRALEGELARLEAEWREAEEIAAIADALVPPPGSDEFVRRHRAFDVRERA